MSDEPLPSLQPQVLGSLNFKSFCTALRRGNLRTGKLVCKFRSAQSSRCRWYTAKLPKLLQEPAANSEDVVSLTPSAHETDGMPPNLPAGPVQGDDPASSKRPSLAKEEVARVPLPRYQIAVLHGSPTEVSAAVPQEADVSYAECPTQTGCLICRVLSIDTGRQHESEPCQREVIGETKYLAGSISARGTPSPR